MENRFSRRNNPDFKVLPVLREAMSVDLRNTIWNCLYKAVIRRYSSNKQKLIESPRLYDYFAKYYWHMIKKPVDSIEHFRSTQVDVFRKHYFMLGWDEIYDLIEFTYGWIEANSPDFLEDYVLLINSALETENSAYRLLKGYIVEVVSKHELVEVENSLLQPDTYAPVKEHLHQAVSLLSDRKQPDFRNSTKESISAVESLTLIVTGKKGTLGQLLKLMEKNKSIPPSIKNAYSALYGYTNNENGIRHAMLEKSELTYADARYMLIVCSAFVNYVIEFFELDVKDAVIEADD